LFKKKPETCAWRDPQYRDNYFGRIRNAIEEERLPYRVEE
jgi:hypothetical protein